MTKGKISKFFVQYLAPMKTGRKLTVKMWRVVNAILYKLKTGIRWRLLPMRQFYGFAPYGWKSVYYHYSKWSQTDVWQECYRNLLRDNKIHLDMSVINLDGTHTPAKRGREALGYQGRKKCKACNMLIITDRQGVPIGWSPPISEEHHDRFEQGKTTSEIFNDIESTGLSLDGLFFNADAGFDTNEFRELCESRDIFPNIDLIKEGVKQNMKMSIMLIMNYIGTDFLSNNSMHGLMDSRACR